MIRGSDLTGKRFGEWLVLRKSVIRRYGKPSWFCRCSCGTYKVFPRTELTKKTKPSTNCGCVSKRLPRGEAAFNHLYGNYRLSANGRGLTFQLNRELFRMLVTSTCFYCGVGPQKVYAKNRCSNGNFTYNGIDRVDNKVGYVEGNVVPCCYDCNHAKRGNTQDYFESWIQRLIKFRREV